jgi:multicomponent Na+:H+ antiporter subunit D
MSDPLVWTILVPTIGALLAFVDRRAARAVGLVASLATTAAVAALAVDVAGDGARRYLVGAWGAPLGIDLYVDGFAATMLITTATVGLLVSVYAAGYLGRSGGERAWTERESFWPLWLFLWASLNALFLSADIFNIYVTLELLGVAAVALVLIGKGLDALTAGTRYLLAAFAGSLSYLLGVAFLYAATSSLDLYALGDGDVGAPVVVALALMTVGLLLKTGLFPLHFWLPPAHATALGPVSPLLSAIVVKATFYLVLRLWFQALPGATTRTAGIAIGILAATAIVWGSLAALRQSRLKPMIAYSTVAQLGYVFLVLPIAAGTVSTGPVELWQTEAWDGAVFYAVAHAVAKAAIFMAAGTLALALGTDRIEDLRGAAARLPVTSFAFGLAALSLVGLPPSAGFAGKWYLLHASAGAGAWWLVVVMTVGTLLTAGYLLRPVRRLFREGDPGMRSRPVPRGAELATLVLALVAVGLGLRATELLELIRIGSPFPIAGGA